MRLRSTLTAGLVLFVSFCGTVQADPPSPGWSIVWQDEFESGTVDTGKWNVNDRQDYDEYGRQSRFHPDRATIEPTPGGGGNSLAINNVIHNPSWNYAGVDYEYSGAWLRTWQTFTYGYFEARVRTLAFDRHIWPTFWMYQFGVPDSQIRNEFDIMEQYNSKIYNPTTDLTPGQSHHQWNCAGPGVHTHDSDRPGEGLDQWHVWGLLWTPDEVSFYVDDILKFTFPNHSCAVGAQIPIILSSTPNREDQPDLTYGTLPTFYVDYVRVWKNFTSYNGTPQPIPGRIEAEEYDFGGEGVAYHDTTSGNQGPSTFRDDDVDLEARDRTAYPGAFTVGYIETGEWLEYSVNAAPGVYDITARVASPFSGQSFTVWLDGTQIATVAVPNTGDWGAFEPVTVSDIAIAGGDNVILKLVFDCPGTEWNRGLNINWIEFAKETDPPTPDPATWASVLQANGSTSINMIATTGDDVSDPVEFYFDFDGTSGSPGGLDSGWQTQSSYTNSDLDPDTEYSYRVQMRDAEGNTTDWSGYQSATTLPYLYTNGPFLEVGGQVCMEAEHYQGLDARSDSPDAWTEDMAVSGYVGSGYMWAADGEFSPEIPVYDDGTRMLYDIDFTTTGTYTVYLRRFANSTASDSVWVGLDGTSTGEIDNDGADPAWIWKNLGTVNVSSAGIKTLDIARREDGYMIDRIVVTQGAAPSGTGPEESLRDFSTTMLEYAIFSSHWQQADCDVSNDYCSGADINKSETVDIIDLQMLAEKWLNGM